MISAKALAEIRIRQERIRDLLKNAGVREPWNLDKPADLYAVRAIRLGAI